MPERNHVLVVYNLIILGNESVVGKNVGGWSAQEQAVTSVCQDLLYATEYTSEKTVGYVLHGWVHVVVKVQHKSGLEVSLVVERLVT